MVHFISFFFLLHKVLYLRQTVTTDHTPRFAASDLGLHCLPSSSTREARHEWLKLVFFEPPHEKTCFLDFRQGMTQTGLFS